MKNTIKVLACFIAVFIAHSSFAQIQEVLMLTVSSGGNSDQTAVRFLDEATDTFDSQYDAYKWDNPGNTPNLFTVSDESYAINAMAKEFEEKTIALYFKAAFSGSYTLNSDEIGAFDSTWSITLIDNKMNTETDLRSHQDYVFQAQQDDASNRFSLQFNVEPQVVTSAQEKNAVEDVIYAYGANIMIDMALESSSVFITDMLGNEVFNAPVSTNNESVWSFCPGKNGIYIVSLLSNNKRYYKKVYVDSNVVL
ncbi:MAG: large protein [Cytophagaceae bacterium]|jgi:hypothetical protein|nr:large protein [Cytophagaceae bacterium]